MTHYIQHRPGAPLPLPQRDGLPATVHVFEADSVLAINAALAAGRPLLVRGEPGTGKSQLARAAAEALGRAFVVKVVDERTETGDLLYTLDAVARLAEAQIQQALGATDSAAVRANLDVRRFVQPGPLWWAFDWPSAADQASRGGGPTPTSPADWKPADGCVVLLDELDKADSAVPNGLLEPLGCLHFPAPGGGSVQANGEPPLVIVTTNEERVLPDAFVRRCLVLELRLPDTEAALVEYMVGRGAAHFPEAAPGVLRRAASLLAEDRKAARERDVCPPGQAEYLDLVRAVQALASGEAAQTRLLDDLRRFTYRKHPAGLER